MFTLMSMVGLYSLNGIRSFLIESSDTYKVLKHFLEESDSSKVKKTSQTKNMIICQGGKAQTSWMHLICGKKNE